MNSFSLLTLLFFIFGSAYEAGAEVCKDETFCKDLVASVPDCSHLKSFERDRCPVSCNLCATERPQARAPDKTRIAELMLESDYTTLYRLLGFPNTTVEMGNLRGVQQGAVNIFYGVPYAQPPLGNLRFRKPVPHPGWTGIRGATEPGYRCMQEAGNFSSSEFSEDCLTLNVYVPLKADSVLLPVVVYFHGGDLLQGSSLEYDARNLALNLGAVVVTVNYRLGFFGFLSSGDEKLEGNFGLYDQRLALQWVKRHIANFNGNPDEITIVGYAAGGRCVAAQIISPLNSGILFQRAIILSYSSHVQYETTRKHGEIFRMLLNATSCTNAADQIECLRSKSAEEIVRITADITTSMAPNYVVEFSFGEEFLPGQEDYFSAWASNINQYKVIMGLDGSEDMMELGMAGTNLKMEGAVHEIMKGLDIRPSNLELVTKILQFNYRNYDGEVPENTEALAIMKMLEDWRINVPSLILADKFRQRNVTTHFFHLALPTTETPVPMNSQLQRLRMIQTSLAGYFFGAQSLLSSRDDAVGMMLVNALKNFVRSGNITLPGSNVTWSEYDPARMNILQIAENYSAQRNRYARARDLWTNLVPYVISDRPCDDDVTTPSPPTKPPEQCADLEEYLAWKEEYTAWLADYKTWKAAFQKYKKLADEGKACTLAG